MQTFAAHLVVRDPLALQVTGFLALGASREAEPGQIRSTARQITSARVSRSFGWRDFVGGAEPQIVCRDADELMSGCKCGWRPSPGIAPR